MKISLDYFINIALQKQQGKTPRLVVVCPYEEYSISAIKFCVEKKLIEAVFVGEKQKIETAIKESKTDFKQYQLIEATNNQEAADIAMALIRDKKGEMLMKGLIDTSVLLKTLLKPEYDLRTDKIMTHCTLSYHPDYKKYYIISDPAMLISPTLEQKKVIIENAVQLAHALGNNNPKVANLCAKEKPYEKMPNTMDAQKLHEMNVNGEIKGCIVSGPLQLDLAVDQESAQIKGSSDPVAGDADVLICPNIEAANIFTKGLNYLGGWSFAGIILGSKVPFVLTSRSTKEEDRILSIALACACASH